MDLTKHAEAVGADLAIPMSPSITRTGQQAYEYFKSVADTVKIGIAIYNQPLDSGYMISPAGIAKQVISRILWLRRKLTRRFIRYSTYSQPLETKLSSAAP